MIFRPLSMGDINAVAAIEARVSPDPWSAKLFAGELDVHQASRHWLVAEDSEAQIVGFGGTMFVAGEAHVMNIAVSPDHARKGIARRLLARLITEAIERGSEALTLEVRVSNEPAIALYRQFKLAPVGARPRYYPDGENALILRAIDIDQPLYAEVLARGFLELGSQ